MEEIKTVLLPLYNRKKTDWLSSMEESCIFEISRRPDILKELKEITDYRSRELKFFPRSLATLVSDWQKILDHSRVGNKTPDSNFKHPATILAEARLAHWITAKKCERSK